MPKERPNPAQGTSITVDFAPSIDVVTPDFRNSSADHFQIAQENGDYSDGGNNLPISARQAASIAKRMVPGARVLKVVLLSSGEYAVTLKGDGKLTRVTVNGYSGAVN